MRIAVDASCWANARGYGRYARELLGAMVAGAPEDEFVFLLDPRSGRVFDLEAPNVVRLPVPQRRAPTEAAVTGGNRAILDMLRFTRALWSIRPDVFFSPSVYTFFPVPPGQRAVIAVHDAIAERFPEQTLPTRRDRLLWRIKVHMALLQARIVLTVSEYAKSELARVLRLDVGRIRVAVEAPAAAFRPDGDPAAVARAARAAGVPEGAPWLTYVGGFNPHKNVPALVRAFAGVSVPEGSPAPHLVLVGSTGSEGFHGEVGEIRRTVEREGASGRVHWAGYLPDDELRSLLSGSTALVLISESEGFGLPAVEAAACGCPVIATVESPLPHLLRGGGWFVGAGDVESTRSAMQEALTDEALRRERGGIARQRASRLSWADAAAEGMAALREASS